MMTLTQATRLHERLTEARPPLTKIEHTTLPLEAEEVKHYRYAVMNARDYADIRRWGRDHLNIECSRERLRAGIQATLVDTGTTLVTSRAVPFGSIYLMNDIEGEADLLIIKERYVKTDEEIA